MYKRQRKYKNFGNLFISYWDGDDESILSDLKKEDAVTLVKNNRKSVPKSITKRGSRGASPWILQNYTTLEGLKKSTGYKSIKVRSDEIYPNLEKLAKILDKTMDDTPKKFITSDIFFRKDDHEKFHPSDHIIAGRTDRLKRGFQRAVVACCTKLGLRNKFPEQLICRSLLEGNDIQPVDYKSKKIMQENFEIVPIETMENSIWTCSYRKYDELRSPEIGWVKNIKEI